MTRPVRRRIRPLPMIVIVMALIGFCLLLKNSWQEFSARQRLSQTLGSNKPAPLPHPLIQPELVEPRDLNLPKLPPLGLPQESFEDGFGFQAMFPGFQDNGVKVQETSKAYIIRVPLASADDAAHINLQVDRRHIEISGQTGDASQHDATPGVSIISSFMQSFDTPQDLEPGRVQKDVQRKDGQISYILTIPKKQGTSNTGSGDPNRNRHSQIQNDEIDLSPEYPHSRVF